MKGNIGKHVYDSLHVGVVHVVKKANMNNCFKAIYDFDCTSFHIEHTPINSLLNYISAFTPNTSLYI